MYNPYVVGKNVYLRHPTEEDVFGKWHEWFSDEETTKYLVDRYWPNSKEKQMEFYKSAVSSEDRLVLSIVDVQTNKHIGVGNLSAINWVHRFCNLSLVIGEKEYRKGSYAYECVSLLLRIAFVRLNIRIVQSTYVRSNEFTEKMMKVLRFQEIGAYKDLYWIDGKYQDCILTMITKEDWLRRNGYL